MQITLKESQLGLLNSTTRIPFRYGTACLTRCPQAVLMVRIELDGKLQTGYSGDCLPPSWFDKSPEKNFERQIQDMLAAIRFSQNAFEEALLLPGDFFHSWRTVLATVQLASHDRQWTSLLASFGVSLVERAVIDAICRARRMSFSTALRANVFEIDAGSVHAELNGYQPADWLPQQPLRSVFVRHTIGLSDPLTTSDIPAHERLNDGFPQAFEEYVERTGIRYFKIKVSNRLEHDLQRLRAIARIVQHYQGTEFGCTLDGNEQYKQAEEFDHLIEAIVADSELTHLWRNVVAIEQPLDRKIALSEEHTRGVRELASRKPVIIDESDGELGSYSRAIELGYRGVSSKNCKGTFKSVLNAGITWMRNRCGQTQEFLMTGEDLCSVGIIPTQADLCLAATLGLLHVERNGHHYHPGLSYLPEAERRAALAAHGDFYAEHNGIIAPRLVDGCFQIGSLECVGFGFAVEPDMRTREPAETWTYASLGLS